VFARVFLGEEEGKEIPQQFMYRHLWRSFVNMLLRCAFFIDDFLCKKQNFPSWDFHVVVDCRDFQITGC
jgi:hypothetical protein